MIDLYSGTPGSGKSLHVAEKIYYALKFGRSVVCNFDIDISRFRKSVDFTYIDNSSITPDWLIEYSRQHFDGKRIVEDDILLVLDECQLLFNAREWNKKGRDKWLSFYTQHRKFGYHVILIAQFDRMIDRQIRSLIEYEYVHRKVSNFGWQGKILSIFMGGKTFVAVKVWYPMSEKVGQEFYHARKKFYRLYDTYGDFKALSSGAGNEKPPSVDAGASGSPASADDGLTF